MANQNHPSSCVLTLSRLATLVCFLLLLVGETSSFQPMLVKKASLVDRCGCLLAATTKHPSQTETETETLPFSWSLPNANPSLSHLGRRTVFKQLLSYGAVMAGVLSTTSLLPPPANAEGDVILASPIKVTAIAHTFVTSAKSPSPKPIRENDATRLCTNARVVYLFDGSNDSNQLAQEITELTRQRKADEGPGVTPGNLVTFDSTKANSNTLVDAVVKTARQLPSGDVLVVGPVQSRGTNANGKLLEQTASGLGTFVGGQKGQGVISVLLNGPREDLKLVESGVPTSELLWYSLSKKA